MTHRQLSIVCSTDESENLLNKFLTSRDNECEKLVRGQFFSREINHIVGASSD
jgi:hypothetical protein